MEEESPAPDVIDDRDEDVNAQGGYFGNVLQTAVDRGHDLVVKMLIEAGAVSN